MLTLRERLATLTAARIQPSVARPRPLHPIAPSRCGSPGYAATEERVPLTARRWLPQLAAADPPAAAVLLPARGGDIPPLADWLFLDLETTGLAGGTGTYAFLVGVAQLRPEGLCLRQFFLRDLAAEGALLAELLPQLQRARVIVTYNGKLFDVPLLETRCRLARIPFPLAQPSGPPVPFTPSTVEGSGVEGCRWESLRSNGLHLDLLYPARRLWKRDSGSARLVELERRVLASARPEDVPSELIPQLYFHYLRSGDERPLRAVFRHNANDLVTLAALTARLLALLSAPETASSDATELLGLARLFERARQADRARGLYERALRAGLPAALAPVARLRLSLLCKRQRDYERAVQLWKDLVATNASATGKETLQACEELAICFEHRLDDRGAAAQVTRRALAALDAGRPLDAEDRDLQRRARERFAHRLARLTRKRTGLSLRLVEA